MLPNITEKISPHSTFKKKAGGLPSFKLQTPAFRGKVDAAHLPEVAVAELAPWAWAGASRPRELKARGSELVALSSLAGFAFGLLGTEVLMTEV